jgi:predicted lipoprotein with Yx(FWY)xxD motif
MRALGINLAAVLALALALAGAAFAANVSTAHSGLGRVITNGSGRTLYLFEKDRHGHSACSGICASYWPPLLANGKTAATGVKASLLGTIRRADGKKQVTIAGHPVYLFSGDSKRGQTNGEGLTDFGASWYALSPNGKKIDRD